MKKNRRTKIVATVGPSCKSPLILKQMITCGVDIFRINASHTSPRELAVWIKRIRSLDTVEGKLPAILVDLQGPRVRTGKLKNSRPITLIADKKIVISTRAHVGDKNQIVTSCVQFPQMVKSGDRILIDNGAIELETLAVETSLVRCRVIRGGVLGENKGINLPNAPVTLPALTEQDVQDLEVASRLSVDYIALSFVRSDEDVDTLKRWLKKERKDISVIAKIEKPRAIQHLEAIFTLADGIMVARGDLGIELGLEKVPPIQKELIDRANRAHVSVITATQMLESMINNPYPTRAEVSDVANAVYDGTDAVMLSGETSIGKFPVKTVEMMAQIIDEAEQNWKRSKEFIDYSYELRQISPIHAITHAAQDAVEALRGKGVVVFTLSGKTALHISKLRPECPIYAFCPNAFISKRMNLFWGVTPLLIKHSNSMEQMIEAAEKCLVRDGFLQNGDPVILLSGKQAFRSAKYMTKIHILGE